MSYEPITAATVNAKETSSNKGQANGYPSLDSGSKVPIAQLPTGTSSSTVAIGNDARLSDARTPLTHSHPKSEVSDTGTWEVAEIPSLPISKITDLQTSLDGKADDLGTDDNYVTDAEKVVIGNTSGTNTGDQDISGKQATLVSGTNIKTINGDSILGSGDLVVTGEAGEAFPVGSVFLSVVSTNPGTLLGYGTWSAIAAGKMLVGIDSGDTDFDTVEETGGAKTKTIAQANLPDISTGAGTSHNHTQDSHDHVITQLRDATTGGATTNIALTADTSSTLGTKVTGGRVAVNQAEAAHTHSLGGSGTALNVVNPYFVVYIFKRTA